MGKFATLNRLNQWFEDIDHEFVVRTEVEKFLAVEREKFPDDLAKMVDGLLVTFVSDRASRRLNTLRHDSRRAAARARVIEDVKEMSEGRKPHSLFDNEYVVDDKNTRKKQRYMNGHDHRFVAGGYRAEANERKRLEHFHMAVSRKCGQKMTEDVFTIEQYNEMYRSITGQNR